jgi:peptidyl-prolyl cis-trans isomerase B (cyclophilin B)
VFGRVTGGMEVVDKIEASDTDGRDRPREDALIERLEIQG